MIVSLCRSRHDEPWRGLFLPLPIPRPDKRASQSTSPPPLASEAFTDWVKISRFLVVLKNRKSVSNKNKWTRVLYQRGQQSSAWRRILRPWTSTTEASIAVRDWLCWIYRLVLDM